MSNSVKILYKDFIKLFKHPIDKETIRNIKMFSFDVFDAYLTVMNIKHANVKNTCSYKHFYETILWEVVRVNQKMCNTK